jgi:beta-lactamase superfamily II metal-dependent hydrolase
MKRTQLVCFRLFWLLAAFMVLTVPRWALAQAGFQRMMLIPKASGYAIGKDGASIPAFCIDKGIPTPTTRDFFLSSSRSVTVTRTLNGRRETRPLTDVMNTPGWLNVIGTFQANEVLFIPNRRGLSETDALTFTLNVPSDKPAFLAGGFDEGSGWRFSRDAAEKGVRSAETHYQPHLSLLQQVNRFSQQLHSQFGSDSAAVKLFTSDRGVSPRIKINWHLRSTNGAATRQRITEQINNYKLAVLADPNIPFDQAKRIFRMTWDGGASKPFPDAAAKAYLDYSAQLRTELLAVYFRQSVARRFAQSGNLENAVKQGKAALQADGHVRRYVQALDALEPLPKLRGEWDRIAAETLNFYENFPEALQRAGLPVNVTALLQTARRTKQILGDIPGGYDIVDQMAAAEYGRGKKLDSVLDQVVGSKAGNEWKQFRAQQKQWQQAFPAGDPWHTKYQEAITLAAGSKPTLQQAMNDSVALPIVLSLQASSYFAEIRPIADILSIERGRKLTPEQTQTLSRFMNTEIAPPTARYDDVVFAEIRTEGNVSLVRLSSSGKIEMRAANAPDLNQWLSSRLEGRRIVISNFDRSIRDLLTRRKIAFMEFRALAREMKRDSFDEEILRMGDDAVTQFTHFRTDPANLLETTILRLPKPSGGEKVGYGDAILLRLPDQSRILIDTGHSYAAYEKIKQALGEAPDGKPVRLKVLVTHEDSDHVRGLPRLLSDKDKIQIDQVFMGVQEKRLTEDNQPWWNKLKTLLDERDYTQRDLNATNILQFDASALPEAERMVLIGSSASQNGKFHRFALMPNTNKPGPRIEIVSYKEAATTNQTSLIVKVTHRGQSQLFTGDIDLAVIKELVKEPSLRYFLEADILKWPHHIWWPDPIKSEPTLRAFLQAVNPHTVYFSNIGAKQGGEQARLQQETVNFIQDVLGKNTRIRWTETDGWLKTEVQRTVLDPKRTAQRHTDSQPVSGTASYMGAFGAEGRQTR